jgi:hypothetical protein
MSIAYHGNYCGPGWSAGAYQTSVVSDVAATDAFDATCKEHDATYALGGDLLAADAKFAFTNITSLNPKAMLAGLAVGSQALGRAAYRGVVGSGDYRDNSSKKSNIPSWNNQSSTFPIIHEEIDIMTKKNNKNPILEPLSKKEKQNLRKVIAERELLNQYSIKPNLKQKSRYLDPLPPSLKVATAPVSIGTTVSSTKPITKSTPTGVLVRGREFLCQVYESDSSSFQLSAAAPLHPAYYVASTMGQMARAYQRYRFRRCAIHFVTRQPTSVSGEIALVYSSQINQPAEDGTSANFLPRVMTRGKATLGPLWQNHSLEIDCDGIFRLIDPFTQADVSTNIFGEVQAYTQASENDVAGYLLIDYELEFHTTMFAPHSTLIPLPSGPGAQFSITDSANPVVNAAVAFTPPNIISSSANGTIWRAILNVDESNPAAGTTLADCWYSGVTFATSTTAYATNLNFYVPVEGSVLYLLVVGSKVYAYLNLEGAIAGDASGQIFYRTAGTSTGVWEVNAYVIQQPPQYQARTQ